MVGDPKARRPRKDLSSKEKYEMIVYIEKNPRLTLTTVAAKFSIPRTTLSGIASNATEIKIIRSKYDQL